MPDFSTTDVAAHVGQNVPNPLTTLSGIVALRNAQNQLKLFPLQVQQAQADVQAARLRNTAAQRDAFNAILASTKNNAEATAALARGAEAGIFDHDFATALAGGNIGDLSPDKWDTLRQQAIMAAGNEAERGANFGTTSVVHTGPVDKTIVTKVGPGGATVEPAGGSAAEVPLGLSPEVAQTPAYTRFNPQTQQQEVVTKAEAAAHPDNPRGIPGSAPLGAEASANTYGAQQAGLGSALVSRGDQVQGHKSALENMRDQVDQFAAGPQSGLWQGIGSFFSQFGLDPSVLNKNLGTNAAAAKTEFDKLALQVMHAQAEQAGLAGTDQQNRMATESSPHSTMTPLAIKRMLGVIEGNEDYIKAKSDAWTRWQPVHGAGSYSQFQSAFNSRYDPRVFQSQYLDAEGRAAMLKGMSDAQKKLFRDRYNDAVQRGLISAQ